MRLISERYEKSDLRIGFSFDHHVGSCLLDKFSSLGRRRCRRFWWCLWHRRHRRNIRAGNRHTRIAHAGDSDDANNAGTVSHSHVEQSTTGCEQRRSAGRQQRPAGHVKRGARHVKYLSRRFELASGCHQCADEHQRPAGGANESISNTKRAGHVAAGKPEQPRKGHANENSKIQGGPVLVGRSDPEQPCAGHRSEHLFQSQCAAHSVVVETLGGTQQTAQGHALSIGDVHVEFLHQPGRRQTSRIEEADAATGQD